MAEDKPLFPLGQAPQPQAFLGTDREGSPQTQSRVSHLHGSEAGFLTKFQSRGENLLLSSLSPTSPQPRLPLRVYCFPLSLGKQWWCPSLVSAARSNLEVPRCTRKIANTQHPSGTPGPAHRPSTHHAGREAESPKVIIKDTEATRAEGEKKSLQTLSLLFRNKFILPREFAGHRWERIMEKKCLAFCASAWPLCC